MNQRRLGLGGPLMGEVGLGAMSFGDYLAQIDRAPVRRAPDHALDLGSIHKRP